VGPPGLRDGVAKGQKGGTRGGPEGGSGGAPSAVALLGFYDLGPFKIIKS